MLEELKYTVMEVGKENVLASAMTIHIERGS